ncbi:hypothetical protein [Gluconacetobacter liquefaciens]|uniref:Uncharacterized protein n=1 Tax=Gluconacetobacter liquefaciens TaxID=89584 RepID=A0A370G9H3_GLULI|nr:hypothetical protein [Gluconacetobacter liquefaciens]MBB2185048.1 hypothetical protein [Gluconacetobacter liquefaciens]RDI40475.1 hypothetical protein C7453_101269 [Gluconacetobacter liquefaciens]
MAHDRNDNPIFRRHAKKTILNIWLKQGERKIIFVRTHYFRPQASTSTATDRMTPEKPPDSLQSLFGNARW